MIPTPGGCWVAYYPDRSEVVVFGCEIEALRYAVAHEMKVHFVPFGSDAVTGKER